MKQAALHSLDVKVIRISLCGVVCVCGVCVCVCVCVSLLSMPHSLVVILICIFLCVRVRCMVFSVCFLCAIS